MLFISNNVHKFEPMKVKEIVEYLNTLPQEIEVSVLTSLENGDYKVKKITWLKILQDSSTGDNILIVENE